jgi:hypothetical protein
MSEPLTDKQVKAILRKEYPYLFAQDIDRLAKTCTKEKWFIELVKSKRLSDDLKTGNGPVVVAANAGGVDKDNTPATCEKKYGETPESYFDDPDPESLKPDRDRDTEIKILRFAVKMLCDCRTDPVRLMRASVGLALFEGQLNLGEIARHLNVTAERVKQIEKEVKGYEISARQQ